MKNAQIWGQFLISFLIILPFSKIWGQFLISFLIILPFSKIQAHFGTNKYNKYFSYHVAG